MNKKSVQSFPKNSKKLKLLLQKITLLIFDFDGVFTDSFVYVGPNGEEFIRCSKKDGWGIWLIRVHTNIRVMVVSSEENAGPTQARCKKLNIECHTGVKDKVSFVSEVLKLTNTDTVAYMGDDLNDLEAMKLCGFKITVADGHPLLKEVADYITIAKGGNHAVREVCELILKANKQNITTPSV